MERGTITKTSILALGLFAASCMTHVSEPTVSTSTQPIPPKVVSTQIGTASFYGGDGFDGKKTASGEIFDSKKFTAAHRVLPFGSRVKVTNVRNGRFVEVRVNDRGPFVGGRLIDVSRAAAQELDILGQGIERVRLDVLE